MLELPRNNVLITSYIVAAGVQLNYYLTATISHFLVRVWRTKSWESRPHIFLIKISFPFWLWTIFMILAWSPHTQLWAIGRDHVNNIKVIWKSILPQLKLEYDKVTFLKIPCCGQHIMITIGKNYCPGVRAACSQCWAAPSRLSTSDHCTGLSSLKPMDWLCSNKPLHTGPDWHTSY